MFEAICPKMKTYRVILIFAFFGFGAAAKQIADCNQLEKFVKEYGSFIGQFTLETYPVNSFCTSNQTVWHYKTAVEWFGYAQSNKTCERSLNQNRLNVFQMLNDQMTSIWDAAHCQDCVSNQKDTEEFFDYYDEMQRCTKKYTNPCDVCSGNYTQMQTFYENLVQNRKGMICFDIEDRMNQTRYGWSAIYNCCKGKQHSQTAFIWFASGISSLPVIFYVMMYLITLRKEARQQAAAPLLNDQSMAGTVEERDRPQACTSGASHGVLEDDNQKSIETEPKLNNLDKAGVRESKLIDLNECSNDLRTEQDLKSFPSKAIEDDDVSILTAPNDNVRADNFLD